MRVDEIKERLTRISPYPWRRTPPEEYEVFYSSDGCICDTSKESAIDNRYKYAFVKDTERGGHIHTETSLHHVISRHGNDITGNYDWEEGGILKEVDTEFIAHAPEDIAYLLSEVDRLKSYEPRR